MLKAGKKSFKNQRKKPANDSPAGFEKRKFKGIQGVIQLKEPESK